LDPKIEIRPTLGQIDDLMQEIKRRIVAKERTMIVTLTIRMAEEFVGILKDRGIKVAYLHNETLTLERTEIIYQPS
jgi:excinuclease ABC subunit B